MSDQNLTLCMMYKIQLSRQINGIKQHIKVGFIQKFMVTWTCNKLPRYMMLEL